MNTARDDGRQESLGEQTLSFRPVRDDDFDAFDAGSAKAARAGSEEPRSASERERDGDSRPARSEEPEEPSETPSSPMNFFAPARPVTGADRPAPREPAAPVEPVEFTGPSLFVKPAGPATPEDSAATGDEAAEQPGDDEEPRPEAEPYAEAEPHVEDELSGDQLSPEGELSDEGPEAAGESQADEDEPHAEVEPYAEVEPHVEDEPDATDVPHVEDEPDAEVEPRAEDELSGDQLSPEDELSDEGAEGEQPRAADEQQAGDEGAAEEDSDEAPKGTRVEALPAEAAEALTAALDALRESVADLRFGLDLPGAEEARQAQADLLAQLQDYVLPRVRTSAAPALIVIAGSTGAGKSTLINSLAERNVSRTGVRRPTTGTPVLVCHPEDRSWFAEGELLGGLQRLDKAAPRDDGMRGIVIVATEKLPQGVALLDTPDIDSVVEEHHEIAHRMLDAADLWIFVTTAARYADAPAWNLLKLAKERGARLAIVLSRVQPRSAEMVLKHFVRMLTEYGLGEIDRFVIHEATVGDGRLPDSEVTDLRLWLAELSVDEERRAQAVRETLNGVLNSFKTRVPALAKHLEGQVAFRAELRGDVEAAFLNALGAIEKASRNGSLLHGEVLARWQDFAGSGDLMRSLQLRKRGRAASQAPERVLAFKAAIRTGLESVIVAAANRAAEEVVARWRHRSELGAKLGEGLDRPSDNLVRHTGRAIASWQDHLGELVRTEGVAKRSVSKLVSFDPDVLSLIFMVAMFSGTNGEGVPHRLVNALLGAESLRGIGAKALSDLRARIGMLFDEEAMRYVQALDSAGIPDESVATRLYQATYNLEVAR
ncbi:dynamin family protein [Nonomuraea sp. H19]|uniref:dynamin family protein n=1 Tax=Nonomuraea sp. H19 TaxID=3452206 RepID=UPI003F8A0498